ncbi:divalent metal cation transporter [Candidatus Woesebacteria bacterium]|nr:divalent metal cation transporter [Candidatus Woesebacteria bacterium]
MDQVDSKLTKLRKILKALGPGFITGASDDDPTSIATYSQASVQFSYGQLWTALFSTPFMIVVQEICGRIGMVTGMGLSGVIRRHYAKAVLYGAVFLLLIANTISIGADLGAMASSAQLLLNIPYLFWLLGIATFTILLEVFVPYPTYARYLKFLTLSLFAYIITALLVKQDWGKIIYSTLVPSITFSKDYVLNIAAILGTTISPYLFFWQADEEVEEEIKHHKIRSFGKGVPKVTNRDLREMRLDTVVGMIFSNLVTFFIIAACASTLGVLGIRSIETADQAALALKPIAGNFAFLLFAMGIIGTGFLAVPILAGSAAYALSEAFNWKTGLGLKLKQAHGFYGVIIIATLIGLLINFTPIKPFTLLYYTAILNGVCAPPLLVLIMLIGNNKNIMGENTNSGPTNIFGWAITGIMAVVAIALITAIVS